MNEAIRPCPRCDREMELFDREKVAALAAGIPLAPSLAAEERVIEKRLAACSECEALREEVLCSHCGCFILFRARPSLGYCPHPNGDRWK